VEAAVTGDDLVTSRDGPGQADCILIRLRAAVHEEDLVDVARCDVRQHFCELRARLRRRRRVSVAEFLRLVFDGLDDPGMLMAGVDVEELRAEVEIAFPLVVPEVNSQASRHDEGLEALLRRPGMQHVVLLEPNDLLRV